MTACLHVSGVDAVGTEAIIFLCFHFIPVHVQSKTVTYKAPFGKGWRYIYLFGDVTHVT